MAIVQEDPLTRMRAFISEKPEQLKQQLNAWTATQPAWVEGAVTGLTGSLQGAFLGVLMGSVGKMNVDAAAASGSPLAPQMLKMGGPVVQARNFAVMTGVNSGVAAFMKRWRGKEDVQNQLVAAFCSGACFSLVSGGITNAPAPPPGMPPAAPPNPLMAAFSAGVVFALFQGGFYKLGEMWSGPKVEDTEYVRVKAMLKSLGLSQYEKNVRKGMLNDATIGLWDTSALQEVRIPAGPRLLILAHIDQYRHILRPAMPVPKALPHE
ncbi:mitochondrial import inner membrane translocase subunit Tim17 Tim22 Tim23 family isoform B [Chlorella sorokiniana]|uniref:Mitochondrial import inner membrane translocase subunit Tim17 Tim22 Tim23 family isoform A n=1 Tax=Chlorella sorokiniana TaxID=3076 RepID=A0A2P6THW1_CHLSO|nr:mitochondrial import inner membrane translocase subunit Tim17 Tim22 Tim23 family isoform A [Chlorella sorokiniana]PRW33882.1 mitochondrial import inner membrane translocase subunit Tim17 Tim22 Tim23 family isoform B [Chlorella sorokiniana]|eukprot:PRW33881.1 mitochondrial import inner membrane translocase subunit Tim17 Tim22 Tim23 family isoform A [Chlorella sorokiniana]